MKTQGHNKPMWKTFESKTSCEWCDTDAFFVMMMMNKVTEVNKQTMAKSYLKIMAMNMLATLLMTDNTTIQNADEQLLYQYGERFLSL